MNQLIGIKNLNSVNSIEQVKRELLFFDKLFFVGLQEWKDVFENKNINSIHDTKEIIRDKGLISVNDYIIYQGNIAIKNRIIKTIGLEKLASLDTEEETLIHNHPDIQYLIEEGKIVYNYEDYIDPNKVSVLHEAISPIIREKMKQHTEPTDEEYFNLFKISHDIKTRVLSASFDDERFMPINSDSSIYNIPDITNIKSKVYRLILNDFPIVNCDRLSFEQIFDFKNDANVSQGMWGLRNWITKISKTDLSISEIEEEYRYLKYKYEESIRLHKLKVSSGLFQTTIQTSAELLENVVKLNFKKVTDVLFKFKEKKISLMEAELKTDGSQFSYLIKVKDKFGK